MKIIISLLLLVVFSLASCGQSQDDIDAAKQKLLQDQNTASQNTSSVNKEESGQQDTEVQAKKLVQVISISEDQFLNFDDISESSLTSGEVKISGTTTAMVDKIEVEFSNPTSTFPNDMYVLQTFEAGEWKEFKYFAASRHQVLDFGENNYIFKAYSGEKVSETKVVLNVPNEDEETQTGTETQLIGEEWDVVLVDLPTSSKYGEPMMMGEKSFTYTQIKGLEINKETLSLVDCDGVTDFLSGRLNSWYYWNTCRDIVKDKGIKFNVIRLDGEDYIYERHYIDFIHGFYGIYELEKWSGVTSENIADKNTELKDQEFPSIEVVDDLLKDIVNS